MAPTGPKRASMRTKVRRTTVPRALSPDANATITAAPHVDSSFSDFTSKKDKRIMKHSSFVSRISKSQEKAKKRRRPSKKLVATLESLADALPDADDRVLGPAKIQHRSLKSRPGAMKKREKLESAERERFGKNMALLAGDRQPTNRWAALRGFISQTMEQKSEFKSDAL